MWQYKAVICIHGFTWFIGYSVWLALNNSSHACLPKGLPSLWTSWLGHHWHCRSKLTCLQERVCSVLYFVYLSESIFVCLQVCVLLDVQDACVLLGSRQSYRHCSKRDNRWTALLRKQIHTTVRALSCHHSYPRQAIYIKGHSAQAACIYACARTNTHKQINRQERIIHIGTTLFEVIDILPLAMLCCE